ncbi:uncharacterized protein [Phyllobates terribilis]|uniref:uncharacterized protein n=1 Tax=Phyllobates terribilis TaxID=111132 RepID=UPI003CCA7F39
MDSKASLGLYPSHRCKTIYLVRHAQGYHNVAGEKDHGSYMSYDYVDATLTPLGWEQVDNLRKHVHASGIIKKIELVIVSPLTRTMQTAVGVFGGEGYSNGVDATPLMVENAWESSRPAISSLNCPPFLAVEQCREHLGVHPCDKRRSIRENKPKFPGIDFSLIETDDDVLWKEDIRETDPEIAARGMKFMEWLWTREEKEIAIVSHSGFLYQTLSAFGNDCHSSVKSEICTHFKNCELRSMVLVDRGLIGSDSSDKNFPGKVPSGADLPSDVADNLSNWKLVRMEADNSIRPDNPVRQVGFVLESFVFVSFRVGSVKWVEYDPAEDEMEFETSTIRLKYLTIIVYKLNQ